MSEQSRLRRLHVQNRLEELRARHGAEEIETPAWLDTHEGFMAQRQQPSVEPEAWPVVQPPAPVLNGHVKHEPHPLGPVFGDLDV